MASPYSVSRQQHRSQPASPIVGFNPIGSSQQPQQPQSSHPGSPIQNLHSSASNSSLRNSLLSGNYAFQQHKPNSLLTQHQSHPSLSSLAQQQQATSPAAGPAALAYANAQLDNFAALQQVGGDSTNNNNNQAAAYYAASASTSSAGSSGNPAHSPQQQGNAASSSSFKVSSPNSSRPLSTGSSTGAAAFAPQMTQLPPGLDMSALNIHSTNSSAPASAASSPGWSHRRLPSGSHHFVGGPPTSGASPHPNQPPHHNPRVAASSVTGKRLNWGEMIAATIFHSENGRLVIQDLFEQMCSRFPEVQEWAFGKDWEGRVKNRIKSTLSIKGHLFVKVPRPSSAAGKGSWWTLSQEAQEAVRENRLAPLLKLSSSGPGAVTPASHSRSGSRTDAMPGNSTMTSAANSRYNSPGPASGAATPVRHFAAPHPLTPSMDSSTFEKLQQQRDHEQQQAQHAAHLQKLQAHLLRQQEQQREALPESYDPNAPPSFSANLPPGFYNVEGMAGLSSPVGSVQGGQASGMDQQMYSSSVDRNLLQALQTYGSSFGGQGQNNNNTSFQGGMDIDQTGNNSLGRSANDSAMSAGSFGSNSFDATWRALTMTGINNGRATVPNTNFDWKSGGMSDANVSDSVDSASASSNSGYTNTTGGGRGTGSSSSASASSYGIGSPQSIPHLGGPQSMPFPAASSQRPVPQQQGVNSTGNGSAAPGPGQPGGDGTGTGDGGQTQGRPRGSTFDFGPGSQAGIAMGGAAGPSGMLPFALNGDNSAGWASQLGLDQGKGGNNGFGGNGFLPFNSDGTLAIDGNNAELFSMMQNAPAPNPFGMRLAGGYAMPIPDSSGRGPHPYSHQQQQQRPSDGGGGQSNGDGSGSAWSQSQGGGNSIPPASPAGSFSSFFAYTPATGPIDTPNQRGSREGSEAGGGPHSRSRSIDTGAGVDGVTGTESALGPMIGSRRRTSNAGGPARNDSGDKGERGGHHLYKVEEGFALPPPATG